METSNTWKHSVLEEVVTDEDYVTHTYKVGWQWQYCWGWTSHDTLKENKFARGEVIVNLHLVVREGYVRLQVEATDIVFAVKITGTNSEGRLQGLWLHDDRYGHMDLLKIGERKDP